MLNLSHCDIRLGVVVYIVQRAEKKEPGSTQRTRIVVRIALVADVCLKAILTQDMITRLDTHGLFGHHTFYTALISVITYGSLSVIPF